MELTQDDFLNGHKIVNDSILMNEIDFENYIRESIRNFISSIDNMNNLQNRKKVQEFLSHISNLYLNIMLNGNLYLLGKREEELAKKGRMIIMEYLTNFIKEGV